MTVNYLVGVEPAFLEQHSTEPAPSRNALVRGYRKFVTGYGGRERDREMERERGKKKERKRRGTRGTENCLFRKWLKDRGSNVLNLMFFL